MAARQTESVELLVERARQGDIKAYGDVVRCYQEAAFGTAYLITEDASEAEDAAQEAFVKAYKAMGRFRRGAPFGPWLLKIVANEAKNHRRAAGRREGLALRAAERLRSGDGAAPSAEAKVLAAERREVLLEALRCLSEDDRLVLWYRYYLDLSEAEMADALGCSRGTIKSRLFRAMRRTCASERRSA